jgi:hypothetical protein
MTRRYFARLIPFALALCSARVGSAGGGAGTALIVSDSGLVAGAVTILSGYLTAAGYTVAPVSVTVPAGSLAAYAQIWDLRVFDNISVSDTSAYLTYLQGGGSLFVMGENYPSFSMRDISIVTMTTALGGGSPTLSTVGEGSANLQTVRGPFTGPNAVSTITYQAVGGFVSFGTGTAITLDQNNLAGSMVFAPGTLSNAPAGTMIITLDVNFLLDPQPSSGEIPFGENLVAYLAAPVAVPPLPMTMSAPALSLGGMFLLAASLVAVALAGLRMQPGRHS